MFSWTGWFRKTKTIGPSLTRIVPEELLAGRACGMYQPLYKYLENRYATTVVLRLSEIEDILGFRLPASARTDRDWWTIADPNTSAGGYCGAWRSAKRTAVPNFPAGTVIFERGA
jgi:hypothetical protein